MRELYRRYVGAFVTLVRPEALVVASETNLIRALSPSPVYAGLVAANLQPKPALSAWDATFARPLARR